MSIPSPPAPLPVGEPATRDVDDLARSLASDPQRGIDAEEARSRLASHGRNALDVTAAVPPWRRLLAHLHDPLIYLLLAAIVISVVAWSVEGARGWPVDALVIAAVVLVNVALAYWQDDKAMHAVAALARLTQATATVIRGGARLQVPSAELVPGDLLLLAEGDAVGADARLVSVTGLRAKEDSLTGESDAVLKDTATLSAAGALGDRRNMVFKGTSIVQGHGSALVTHTGMATQVGAIATMLDATASTPTPLESEIARIGRTLAIAVLVISAVVVATIVAMADARSLGSIVAALLLGVSLAVAAVPEGLPAILSVVLAMGVQRMARHHAIMKTLASVESLGAVTVICTDKTGTLTRSEMTVERAVTASGAIELEGVGVAMDGDVRHDGAALQDGALRSEMIALLGGGSLAGNAALQPGSNGLWAYHGDPTEVALLVAEHKLGTRERRLGRFGRVGELPFDPERKRMSVIARDHEHGDALHLVCKGAPDVLLALSTHARIGTGVVALDDALRRAFEASVQAMSGAALRTLAVATRPLSADEACAPTDALERGLVFVGIVGMRDPPRPEVGPAIADARRAGVRVVMITGDHPRTALRIALDLHIVDAATAGGGADTQVLDGTALDALDDLALVDAARRVSVFARVSPAHKLRIVAALQADGQVVAMTGDGVNDAPALKAADIGIAMGITGTEVAKESARMILADDNFATIVAAVREGRVILDNIRTFLRYLLTGNMGEVLTVFLGVVGAGVIGLTADDGGHAGVVFPLLATQILWINLVTDSWPALAIGVDPPSDDVMARAPRRLGDRVIDARMWRGVFGTGLVIAVVTLLVIDLHLPGGLIEGTARLDTARTAGFTVLVLAHVFQAFNARSATASAFRQPFSNRWLCAAVALSVALQVAVVHLPVLNAAFGTVPLAPADWALCVAMASTVLWTSEAAKWLAARWSRTAGRAAPDAAPQA